MIEPERITKLNETRETKQDFVIYWMQQSQRTHDNHALEFAAQKANDLNKPLLVYFGITSDFPDANWRHYHFMLQGLQDVEKNLSKRNIRFILGIEHPVDGMNKLSREAALVVVDCGYLRIQKQWRNTVAAKIDCPLFQVESDVIVPVETASEKEEYAAYTLRPKIHRKLSQFLTEIRQRQVKISSLDYSFPSVADQKLKNIVSRLSIDDSVSPVESFVGGEQQARKRLAYFLHHHLHHFDEQRNDPSLQVTSQLSPYLHFGQISPLFVALQVKKKKPRFAESFLEELIVRRELSMNFVHYNDRYDQLSCLPDWAFDSLQKHEQDKREYVYSRDELEQASTHDSFWNAAQNEMRFTGKMHGYMRMYWGKKILEWSKIPKEAFDTALYLNNKYELDGRDPNGFTGVAWCFGKHDRAWKERDIFGKIRYMSDKGLKRKGDMDSYLDRVGRLSREHS
ncbi:MAG: deoxyribodipyrimidine photo-lyase [Thermoplasmatota archaeon]